MKGIRRPVKVYEVRRAIDERTEDGGGRQGRPRTEVAACERHVYAGMVQWFLRFPRVPLTSRPPIDERQRVVIVPLAYLGPRAPDSYNASSICAI